MTLRARPVRRGPGRSGWNSGDRRTFLLNLGFAIAIAISLVILVGYVAWSWYDDHFGAAATVDGTTITNDQLRTRFAIESFRIDYTESRIRTLQAAGRISDATATSQIEFLEQRRSSLPALSIERLIDIELQSKLAAEDGLTVTEAEIDAGFLDEATTDEARHAWVIEVQPEDDVQTGEPGDAEKAAAKAKAEGALTDLKAGKSWEDIAKTVSTAASAAQDGDLGWMPKESGQDEAFMNAIFAAAQGEPTDVVEGADGIYRIGRVTEIAPASVDAAFEDRITDEEIKVEDYREAVHGDLVRDKLSDKVVADMSKPSLQRHVLEIFMGETTPMPDGVRVRHILFSPKDDPTGAGTLPDTDPAWAEAEAEAKAVYDELVKDPSTFDQKARTLSDEGSAVTSGGKLPFFDPTSSIDPKFAEAIFKEGLEPGDLIPPFKSSFGWHVVEFMRPYGDGDLAWMATLRQQAIDGADFAQLARDQGEGEEADKGGDIGWVAVGQLAEVLEVPIFLARIGDVTDVVTVEGEGIYLFTVLAEEERGATPEQIAVFEESGFTNWYAARKAEAVITRGDSVTTADG
jgi:parvulin-like peptidyl-prolyl isomerase